MTHSEQLRRKIETREARTGIVGLGYVGLRLAVELAHAGFSPASMDSIDTEKAAAEDCVVVVTEHKAFDCSRS